MDKTSSLDHLQKLASIYSHQPALRLHFKSEAGRTAAKQGLTPAPADKYSCSSCYSRGLVKPFCNKKKGKDRWVKLACGVCSRPMSALGRVVEGQRQTKCKPIEVVKAEVPPVVKVSASRKPDKIKAKKDANAGLIIPPKFNSAKLSKMLKKTGDSGQKNRLFQMLK